MGVPESSSAPICWNAPEHGDRKMPRNRRITARVPVLAMSATAGTLCLMTIALSRPEVVLDRSFEAGLAAASRPGERVAATPRNLADSPHFWLSKSEPNQALGPAQPVKLGDRITISSRDGEHNVLEVIDIRNLDDDITHAEATATPRLLLVSCKTVGAGGDRVVRFIVEAGEPEPATLRTVSPRAL
jgi:hypothetical protein